MRMDIEYFNNNLIIKDDSVLSLEIENKSYFFKVITDLINLSNGDILEEIKCFNEDKEVGLTNKINVIRDFFDFQSLFKSYSSNLIKFLCNKIDKDEQERAIFRFNRVCSFVSNEINKIDLPFYLKNDFTFELMLKSLKFDILSKDNLLDNLFLLIDIERELKINKVLFFINLKQYIKKEELVELYKYAIYNGVSIILIDSQSYGVCLECERKLIIDEQLDEFML